MVILSYVVFLFIVGVRGESPPLECTPLEMEECFSEIDIEVKDQGDDLFPNEAFLDKHCSSLIPATKCQITWLETCSSYDYLDEYYSISLQVLNELCDTNSEIRRVYLASIPCINANKEKYLQCNQNNTLISEGFFEHMRKKKNDSNEILRVIRCFDILFVSKCFLLQTKKSCDENIAKSVNDIVIEILNQIEEEVCPEELMIKYVEEFDNNLVSIVTVKE